MPQRKKSARSPTAVNLSGPLGEALKLHAYRRIVWFFRFLFALQASCDYINAKKGTTSFAPARIITAAATHQIDEGLRSDDPQHVAFDGNDLQVTSVAATEFTRTDAAHFCNLGLDAGQWGALCRVAESLPLQDEFVWSVIELAETSAGDTVQLPQRINIGPDRVIDNAHYEIAGVILSAGGPILSELNLKRYQEIASREMLKYSTGKQGNAGLAACCACYLSAYSNQIFEEAHRELSGNIDSECSASKGALDKAKYMA